MINFLTTYFLHSTVLLAAMWLVLRIACPRSPVLIERLWKLAAVLPVITALAMMCGPAGNPSDVRPTSNHNDVIEGLDEVLLDEPPRATANLAEPISDADSSFAQFTEPWPSTELTLEAPRFTDSEVELFPNSVTIDAPIDRNTDVVSSEPVATETAESPELVIAEPTVVAEVEAHTPPERAESWRLPAWHVASALLPIWAVIGTVWLVIRSAWFRWRLRNARRVTRGRAVDLLRELRSHARQSVGERNAKDSAWTRTAHGLATVATQPIRLLIVPGFAEPAAFGVWRPTIVLPPSCESLDREALRAVLAHELGHIARGDLWWLAISRVLTTALGFQPLNRIARREWTRAAECLCDDWAVGRGVERLTLARCLTALAEHRLTGVSLADALAAVGSPSNLRQRIERLIAEPTVDPWSQRSRRWLLNGLAITVAGFLVMLVPAPRFQQTPAVAEGDAIDSAVLDGIDDELIGLHREISVAADRAEANGEPDWVEAGRMLREREARIRRRWFELSGRNAGPHGYEDHTDEGQTK